MFSNSERKKKDKIANLFCLCVSHALKPNDFPAEPHKTEQAKLQTSLSIGNKTFFVNIFKIIIKLTLLRRLRKLQKRSLHKNNK